jgi:hypothetical protein
MFLKYRSLKVFSGMMGQNKLMVPFISKVGTI